MIYQVYVGVLVLLIINVQKGNSSKCYSCSSKKNEACYKPDLSELTPVHCDMDTLDETKRHATDINTSYHDIFEVDRAASLNYGNIDTVCLKVIVKDGNKDYILRGCQLAEQRHLDICKRLEKSNTDMIRNVYCSKCTEDGCNSSPKTFSSNVLLALICTVVCKIFYM